jgi:hypothetical protein
VILRSQTNLSGGFKLFWVLDTGSRSFFLGVTVVISFVETDCGFQDQENVVTGAFYFPDCARYSV